MEKNKAKKYLKYAIGEIILVVIGILIALQVNNWNVKRTNNSLEESYITRILEDLKEERAIMEATLNYANQVHFHAQKAIVLFEQPDEINKQPVDNLIDLYQASQIQVPASANSTYKELIASSLINLFRNENVKKSLIRYYEYNWTESNILNLPNEYRVSLRSKMPNEIQNEIRTKCGDIYIKIRDTYEVTLPKECEINIPINKAKPIVELLKHDNILKEHLRRTIGNNEAKINFITSMKNQLEELIILLEEEK